MAGRHAGGWQTPNSTSSSDTSVMAAVPAHKRPRWRTFRRAGRNNNRLLVAGSVAITIAAIGAANASSRDDSPTTTTAVGRAAGTSSNRSVEEEMLEGRLAARAAAERAGRQAARMALAAKKKATAETRKKAAAAAETRKKAPAAHRKAAAARRAALATAYSLPVSGYRLTAGFGAGGSHWANGHTGLDFAAPLGTAVGAVAPGTIVESGWDGAYGNRLSVRHLDGTETWYCTSRVSCAPAVRSRPAKSSVASAAPATPPARTFTWRCTRVAGLRSIPMRGWLTTACDPDSAKDSGIETPPARHDYKAIWVRVPSGQAGFSYASVISLHAIDPLQHS